MTVYIASTVPVSCLRADLLEGVTVTANLMPGDVVTVPEPFGNTLISLGVCYRVDA
jgi:hypothetical protein